MKKAIVSALLVVVADQLTKLWAVSLLADAPDQTISLIWGADFQLHYNTGAAFSAGQGLGPVIGVVAIVMSVFLMRMAMRRKDGFGQVALGGVSGGAAGNLVDRIVRAEDGPLTGAVIDFLKPVDFFAIFNVADSAIVVGIAAIVIQSVFWSDNSDRNDGMEMLDGSQVEPGDVARHAMQGVDSGEPANP